MRRYPFFMLLVLAALLTWLQASDERFLGAWRTTTYTIEGEDHPMNGIMIFTPSYYSANVILNLTGGDMEDANANSGPYWAEDGQVVFGQWMQLHLRPGAPGETSLKSGADEVSSYRFEGDDHLIIQFPSGNFYTLDRYPDGPHVAGLDGLWSYQTLQSAGQEPVQLDGLFLLHQGSFLQQSINRGRPQQRLGQGHVGTFREGSGEVELTAETGIIVDPSADPPYSSRNNSQHQVKSKRDGDHLTLTFGTGTVQTFQRVSLAGPTKIYWLDGGAFGLADQHFILVVDSGARKWSGSGSFSRDGDELVLQTDHWFQIEDGKPSYRSGSRIRASLTADGLVLEGNRISFRKQED